MRRSLTIIACIALAAVLALALTGQATAGDKEKAEAKMQTHCPIMGNPVDKKVHYDYDGKRIYFCCAPCIEKFKQDPASYVKKMEDDGVTFEKAPGKVHDHDHDGHGHEHDDHGHDDHGHDHGHDHG